MPDAGAGSRLRSWAYALRTTNPPADGPTDTVTRWLVVTRAAVLPMTLVSGLVAGLLAIGEPGLDWRWLVLWWESHAPHIANNLMNDLYDTDVVLTAPPTRAPAMPSTRPLPGPTVPHIPRLDEPPAAAHPSVRWNLLRRGGRGRLGGRAGVAPLRAVVHHGADG